MCLILLALEVSEEYPLVVAANRDEYYARPTVPAQWWESPCRWLGGRDQEGGGTWLAVTPSGRFAAVTNYRDPLGHRGALSRGRLVLDALCGEPDLDGDYSDYNLLWGDVRELRYASNRGPRKAVKPGYHALSNALLDTPWPKVTRGIEGMRSGGLEPEHLFTLLRDRTPAQNPPDTGLGPALEKALSPAYIVTPHYGTRSSTVVRFARDGTVHFEERSPEGTVQLSFNPSA